MFNIPQDPTPQQLNNSLITCVNNISRLQQLVAEYKADVAIKQTAYKRAMAEALVKYQNKKNATLIKAMAELDELVQEELNELDQSIAVYTVALGELKCWEAQFVALRKIAEIKKMEIQGRLDSYAT